jgi:hypothetical protein
MASTLLGCTARCCLVVWTSFAVAISLGIEPSSSGVGSGVQQHGPDCGDSLAERVARALPDGATMPADVAVDATLVSRDDGQWAIDLEIARGEAIEPRSLLADDCDTALEAAAFVIALAVARAPSDVPPPSEPPVDDPPLPSPSAPSPVVAATPVVVAPRDAAPAPVDAPRRPTKVGGFLGVAAGVDTGALPRTTGWFAADVGVRGKYWRAGVHGGARLPTETFADRDPRAGGRFVLWAIAARGCGVPARGVIEVPLCAGIEVGGLRVRGLGFADARTLRRPWFAATVGTSLLWRVVPRIAVGVGIDLGVPLRRDRLEIENLEVLHTTGPVFARALARLEVRLPRIP